MRNSWAEDFYEILGSLKEKADLCETVKELIRTKKIVGKSLEGGNREEVFREILINLVEDNVNLDQSYKLVENKLSEATSIYKGDKRTFPSGEQI